MDDVLREEAELGFAGFDADAAWRLGVWVHDRARRDALPIAIEISVAGHVKFLSALPGSSPDNAEWMRRKRNTVTRFQKSSLALRLICEAKGVSLTERYGVSVADYVASGGGVPIVVNGTGCVGAVVVSGLPDVEDHRLVVDAMRWMLAGEPG
ncbi:hypothetical protein ASG43_08035 [Aureimonas sp. Leaf454]|nr:hypothetical protein ASG43_08035 [Aureimonas sp. Leaf454]